MTRSHLLPYVVQWALVVGLAATAPAAEPANRLANARTLLANGILLEGIYELEQYLEVHPDDLTARMQAAAACYTVGRYQMAADHAGHVYAADRTHAEARRLLVRIRSQLSRELMTTTPEPDDLLFFARLARLMHNIDRAARYYDRYLAHGPDVDPQVRLEWARMYRWHDRGAAAIPLYQDYLEDHPAAVAVRHELGRLYNELGRHVDAARVLGDAVMAQPGNPAIKLDWAQALLWQGDEEAAETILLNLLDKNPDKVAARVILARLYHARQSYLDAYPQYRRIIETMPDHQEARMQLESYRRNRILDKARYRQALQADPYDSEVRTRLIRLLHARDERAAALQELDIHLALHPDDQEMQALRRELRASQHAAIDRQLAPFRAARTARLSARIRDAQRWLAYHPHDHLTRHQLADWWAASGQYWEAWQEYERLLQAVPPSPTLIAARDQWRRKAQGP